MLYFAFYEENEEETLIFRGSIHFGANLKNVTFAGCAAARGASLNKNTKHICHEILHSCHKVPDFGCNTFYNCRTADVLHFRT